MVIVLFPRQNNSEKMRIQERREMQKTTRFQFTISRQKKWIMTIYFFHIGEVFNFELFLLAIKHFIHIYIYIYTFIKFEWKIRFGSWIEFSQGRNGNGAYRLFIILSWKQNIITTHFYDVIIVFLRLFLENLL